MFKKKEVLISLISIGITSILITAMFIYDNYNNRERIETTTVINEKEREKQIELTQKKREIQSEIDEIKKEIKPCILLNFDDQTNNYEKRYKIVKEQYGFNATFAISNIDNIDIDIAKNMINNGWDCGVYGSSQGKYVGKEFLNNPDYYEAWYKDIKTLYDQVIQNGFSPTVYFTRFNLSGEVLEDVLLDIGFKMIRSMSTEDNPYIKSSNKIYGNTGTTQISSSNLNEIKEQIDKAISNKWCLPIFTHLLVDDISEDRGYDTLTSEYIKLLDYIKEKVDEGKVEVLTYREYYEKMNNINEKIEPYKKQLAEIEDN